VKGTNQSRSPEGAWQMGVVQRDAGEMLLYRNGRT